MWVVRTACAIALGGLLVMAWLAIHGQEIPDRLDKYATAALIGALALLGRVSDSKAEAKDAVEKAVNDLAELAPAGPVQVEGVPGGEPVAVEPG